MFKYNLDQKVFLIIDALGGAEVIITGKIRGAWMIKGENPWTKGSEDACYSVKVDGKIYNVQEHKVFVNLQDLVNVAINTKHWKPEI